MTDPQLPNSRPQSHEEDEINLNGIFRAITGLLGSWPYLLFGSILGFSIAFLVNRYTYDTYEIDAKIAVEKADNPLADAAGSLSLNFTWGGSSILKSTVALLKSYSHNLRVAKDPMHRVHPHVLVAREASPDCPCDRMADIFIIVVFQVDM